MDIFDTLTMLGGLALFLFGMSLMGQALERRAGGKLRSGGCTFRCSAARASRSFRGGSNQNRGWTYDHQVWLLSCEL